MIPCPWSFRGGGDGGDVWRGLSSSTLKSFVDEPHSAIDGPAQGEIVNLTDKRAEKLPRKATRPFGRFGSGSHRVRTGGADG
jgi:hypothetical protein